MYRHLALVLGLGFSSLVHADNQVPDPALLQQPALPAKVVAMIQQNCMNLSQSKAVGFITRLNGNPPVMKYVTREVFAKYQKSSFPNDGIYVVYEPGLKGIETILSAATFNAMEGYIHGSSYMAERNSNDDLPNFQMAHAYFTNKCVQETVAIEQQYQSKGKSMFTAPEKVKRDADVQGQGADVPVAQPSTDN